jgi:hypothetical protein
VQSDPFAVSFERVVSAALDGPGVLASERRRVIAERAAGEPGAPADGDGPLAAYLERIARHAYRTTDEEVAALARQLPQDAILEATLAAAVGAARRRLAAALAVLEEPAP